MAASPVPHGWEHVPAVGTGTGMHEIAKTAAPSIARRGVLAVPAVRSRSQFRSPTATKGSATSPHTMHQRAGSTPSVRCIAYAGDAASVELAMIAIAQKRRTFGFIVARGVRSAPERPRSERVVVWSPAVSSWPAPAARVPR